jgi:hypothetical protein
MSKRRIPKVPGTKARPMPDHKRVCLLVGATDDPVVAVTYHEHRVHAHDSGYMLFTSSAPRDPADATDDDFETYCLACLRECHPEAQRGLLLAEAYGGAYWDDEEGGWVADDDDGNEIVFENGDELPAQPDDPEAWPREEER